MSRSDLNEMTIKPLVSADWLADNLEDPHLRILECTVAFRRGGFGMVSGREEWAEAHIPRSGFADLTTDLSHSNHHVPLMMPPPDQFSEAMGRLGVGPGNRVILYDRAFTMWAARVWWMLRAHGFDDAAVLDGGWRKWIADGRVVSTAPPDHARATFEPRPRPGLIATKDEVLAGMEQDNTCLICGLSPKEYSGEVTTYGRPGHIPGSSNVPARHLVNRETHEFLPLLKLQELVEPTGGLTADRVITYCGGGTAGSSVAFVLTLLGHTNVAVYDGSLLEWAADPDLPLSTGSG